MEGAIFCLDLDVAVIHLDRLNGVAATLPSRLFAGRAKATYSDLVGCRMRTFCMLLRVDSKSRAYGLLLRGADGGPAHIPGRTGLKIVKFKNSSFLL